MDSIDIIKILAPLLFGGVVGSLLTSWFSRQRAAKDLTVKIAEKYFDEFHDYREAMRILSSTPATSDMTEANTVRRHGDWWEIVSIYRNTGTLDRRLFDTLALEQQRLRFRDAVATASSVPGSCVADARAFWPNLFQL